MPFNKRVAILGSSFGTKVTAPALRAEGWEIVALFSRRAHRAAEVAGMLGIPHHSDDFRAIVSRDDIDTVVVSTPTATHREHVLAALDAGKHVLCEKPFAMSEAEAREMIAAAEATDRTTMVNFEFRHTDHRLHITRLIEEGRIGRPQSATANLYFARLMSAGGLDWRSQLAMGGGALNEQGSHYFDALRGWMGEITSVYAHIAVHEPLRIDPETGEHLTSDADDYFSATLTFESGAAANVSMIWSGSIPGFGDLYITGPGGTIAHHGPLGLFSDGPVTYTPPMEEEDAARPLGHAEEGPPLPRPADIEPLPEEPIIASSRRLLREFERGIAEGTSPSPNFEDGLRAQLILDAARESARTGRVVELRPV